MNARRVALWLMASTLAITLMAAHIWAKNNDKDAMTQLPYQPNIYPAVFLKKPVHGINDGLAALWESDWGKVIPDPIDPKE